MATGQAVFFSGVGLLIVTVILAIFWGIKKPQYRPENAVYQSADGRRTQKLCDGYPTDSLSIRREMNEPSALDAVIFPQRETEPLVDEQSENLHKTIVLQDDAATDISKITEKF